MTPLHESPAPQDREDETPKDCAVERPSEPDHPLLLTPAVAWGDPGFMLECLVSEYALLGYDRNEILEMFDRPFFEGTYNLGQTFGPTEMRRRVASVLDRTGTLKVRVAQSSPDPEGNERCDSCAPALDECFEPIAGVAPPPVATSCQACLVAHDCSKTLAHQAVLEG